MIFDIKKKVSSNDIVQGSIARGLLSFFFPILLGTFFQQLYNTVDAVIVGRFVGKEALAAVGGGTVFYVNMLVGFFTGLAGGAGVVISQFYGADNREECLKAVHTSIILSVIFGVIIMVLGLLSSRVCMVMIGTPPAILELSVVYLRLFFCGMIPMVLYNMGAGILRAAGDSRTPFLVLLVGCVSNIILDWVFVVVLKWSVAGVAIATIASQVICAILTLRCLMGAHEYIRFKVGALHLTPYIARRMVVLGLPTGLQSVMYTVSNLIIQSNVNLLGTNAIAGVAAWGKIDQLFWMTIATFGVALTTFVGQNFGAGKLDRVKRATIECLGMSAIATVALTLFFMCFGRYVFMIFTSDEDVVEVGVRIMRFLCPTFITYISVEILSGAIRGAGRVAGPTIITLFGVCILRLVWMFTVVPSHLSLLAIYLSYPITWSATSALFWVYYFKSGWLIAPHTKRVR